MRVGTVTPLRDVTFEVPDGQTVGLIGPNGSGKTTALRTALGGLSASTGRVLIDGHDTARISARDRARRVAAVLQEEPAVLPLTVAEEVALGRHVHRVGWPSRHAADDRAIQAALDRTGTASLSQRRITDLSGGERQRVLIARALAQDSAHVLLDEPTNHLDVRFQHELLALVASLRATILVVLHDLNLAARYCDRLVLLDQGRVVAQGAVGDVLDPTVIRRVYGIHATRVEGEVPQLVFAPVHAAVDSAAAGRMEGCPPPTSA
ncbi:ABC transporter ATP-binding protein [Microbacterium sp.]|uniref:ABC transporter ATP-binding protein n=1 Tax=Microbacterium sp. TaxID=51671 RepID=UPI0039E4386F